MPQNEMTVRTPRDVNSQWGPSLEKNREEVSRSKGGYTAEFGRVRDIHRTQIVQISRICNHLFTVREQTDPVSRWELDRGWSLFNFFVDKRRDVARANAALDSLDQLGWLNCAIPSEAWFDVFVLVEKVATKRRVEVFRQSMTRAACVDNTWLLQVLAQWAGCRYDPGFLPVMRKRAVELVSPMWQRDEHRERIAPILVMLLRTDDVNFSGCAPRIAKAAKARDWDGVYSLLAAGRQRTAACTGPESMLAAGLSIVAKELDAVRDGERSFTRELGNLLGPGASATIDAGLKALAASRGLFVDIEDCDEARVYRELERLHLYADWEARDERYAEHRETWGRFEWSFSSI